MATRTSRRTTKTSVKTTVPKHFIVCPSECGEIDQIEFSSWHETAETAEAAALEIIKDSFYHDTEVVFVMQIIGKAFRTEPKAVYEGVTKNA